MDTRESIVFAVALLGALVIAFVLVFPPVAVVDPGEYNSTTIRLQDDETTVATVDARIADTKEKRRVGLKRTASLENDSGMLFVHPRDGTYSYHMQNVSFDIDIIFVDANGTITAIHHASTPDAGADSDTYTGRGRYVLEVPRGFANGSGIDVGDEVRIPPIDT